MAIDFTKEVETCDDPPRPVRILCTDRPGPFPVVGLIDGSNLQTWGADGNYGSNSPMNLRNVPEKPPIKWVKAWVNVYPNTGLNIPNQTKEAADKLCSNIRVACIEIDWPVYDEEAGK